MLIVAILLMPIGFAAISTTVINGNAKVSENKKIRDIFIKQNNWITIISIILSLPLGYALVEYLFQVVIEEHYDFNAYIKPLTYIISAVFTFIVSYIVSIYVSKKIKNIDMVSSLKGNE